MYGTNWALLYHLYPTIAKVLTGCSLFFLYRQSSYEVVYISVDCKNKLQLILKSKPFGNLSASNIIVSERRTLI